MVFDYNSYVKVVILGNLCGGALQDPPRRVRPVGPAYLHTREKDASFIWIPPFSLRNALICVPGRGGADEEQRRSRGENYLGEQT